ncbi:MAG: hypothetical protein ACMV1D_05540, partial [Macromonas sp.]
SKVSQPPCLFLSCLCGSERSGAGGGWRLGFLSCLCGSEQDRIYSKYLIFKELVCKNRLVPFFQQPLQVIDFQRGSNGCVKKGD